MTRARCSTCRGTDRDRAKTGADRLRPRRHSMRGRALSLVWLAVMASPLAIAWPDATAAQTTAPQTVDPVTRHVAEASRRFRSEEHTSELQSLMRIPYAVCCLKKTKNNNEKPPIHH